MAQLRPDLRYMEPGRNQRSPDPAATSSSRQVWTERYLRHGAFVRSWGEDLVAVLDPQPGERILDLGCGDGTLAQLMADRGAQVVGVDTATELVALARSRRVQVHVMDAQALKFHQEFDAVFSNAALHWMTKADAVLAGIRRALRPRGRFVGELGGHGNVAAISVAIRAVLGQRGFPTRTPWYFPSADEYRAKLTAHGFDIDQLALFPRPTVLPTAMDGWLETFAGSMLGHVSDAERPGIVGEILALLRPALCDPEGQWTADYVRLRFAAHLRAGA